MENFTPDRVLPVTVLKTPLTPKPANRRGFAPDGHMGAGGKRLR